MSVTSALKTVKNGGTYLGKFWKCSHLFIRVWTFCSYWRRERRSQRQRCSVETGHVLLARLSYSGFRTTVMVESKTIGEPWLWVFYFSFHCSQRTSGFGLIHNPQLSWPEVSCLSPCLDLASYDSLCCVSWKNNNANSVTVVANFVPLEYLFLCG